MVVAPFTPPKENAYVSVVFEKYAPKAVMQGCSAN
jgi:hypothetical protein